MGKDKSETKPKYTREFHSGERNKKEVNNAYPGGLLNKVV